MKTSISYTGSIGWATKCLLLRSLNLVEELPQIDTDFVYY